mmetsp:Transcript_8984/g.14984  ORF Transcript_8984/g.14984 Transcript_8984/m.14984 type:complete len:186 (-) Transcript_8984:1481-2038(-)
MLGSRSVISRALVASLPSCARSALPVASSLAVRHLSTRRRRRGQTGTPAVNSNSSGDHATSTSEMRAAINRPVKVTDMLQFVIAAQDFLDKIEDALEPMKKHNEVFIITREASKLTVTLRPGDGEYSLEIYEDSHSIMMQTPLSGKFGYCLSASTSEWVNEEDGHSLEGMLVRDMIRQCNGFPEL